MPKFRNADKRRSGRCQKGAEERFQPARKRELYVPPEFCEGHKMSLCNGKNQLTKERPGRKAIRPSSWEYIKQDFSCLWQGFLNLIRIGRMSRFRRDEISEWRTYGT